MITRVDHTPIPTIWHQFFFQSFSPLFSPTFPQASTRIWATLHIVSVYSFRLKWMHTHSPLCWCSYLKSKVFFFTISGPEVKHSSVIWQLDSCFGNTFFKVSQFSNETLLRFISVILFSWNRKRTKERGWQTYVCVFMTKTPVLCLEVIISSRLSSAAPSLWCNWSFLHDGSGFFSGIQGIFPK